jgi:DNA polymerase V
MMSDTSRPVFVITYSINDARSGEFDDCPVM